MSKSKVLASTALVVDGSQVSIDVVTKEVIEARTAFAKATGSTYGASGRYAKALVALHPIVPSDPATHWFKGSVRHKDMDTEFDSYKEAAIVAATAEGVDASTPAFKAKLRDQVREIRKQAGILSGLIQAGNGANANEARATLDWLTEEAPKWLKRINRDESGSAKVAKAFENMSKLCKDLGLNPNAIIDGSNT